MTREEIEKLASDYLNDKESTFDMERLFEFAIQALKQEPKTGHWVHWASGDDCSECGWSTGRYIPTTKYCPNCGVKMVEPQESEE